MKKEYKTERLILRILDGSDAQETLDYYERNKDFLENWEPKRSDVFYTLQFQKNQLENDYLSMKRGNSLRLWITKKEEEHHLIGTLAFTNMVRGPFLSCFLGYKLDKDEINKGYMTEAIRKGIEVIFEDYKFHRIEANIMPRNKSSLKVVQKLGFYHEGIAHKYLRINGKWEDHIHMVRLNEGLE